MDHAPESLRTYFIISSRDGIGALHVHQPIALQSLYLPVYPNNAIPMALTFMTPRFAHYIGQWESFTTPDPEGDRDARGFYLEGGTLTEAIVEPGQRERIFQVALWHMHKFFKDDAKPETTLITHNSIEEAIEDIGEMTREWVPPAEEVGIVHHPSVSPPT